MPNEPTKILALNSSLLNLESNPSLQNAQESAMAIINLLGIPNENGFTPLSKVPGTVANQLELAEGYADKRAAYKFNTPDGFPFDIKLFWVQKTSKRIISSLVALTPNFEDEPFYLDKNLGIDIITPHSSDRLILILSSSYNIRLVELKGALTNTQKEIFSKWVQNFDFNNKPQIHTVLWNSFDLKSLNESFYKKITEFFSELKVHLKNTPLFDEREASRFANRLIGRLIFCWFIRKRGLITESPRYLEISPEEDSDTYYHNRLEKLFFSVLNTPIDERIFEDMDTPFLNGGLFEPRSDDNVGASSLTFPKDYFHRFFIFLNQYNFTTDESTSDYQQVAIDPEMLGKIFENLLAEQREDTGEQARKAKGAFYTPREIVDYMCHQSIREYLKSQLADEEGIDQVITDLMDTKEHAYDKGVREKIAPYKQKLTSALDHVKVIDPACGSGAFPMGMLKQLEQLYERIDVRFEPYKTKISIIKNNLYGVDIEPMAVEISRLRAWLSIIVDDDINPSLPNKGIEPLPNLDFKFVCANSLIGMELKPKIEQLSIAGDITGDDVLLGKLMNLRDEWFDPKDRGKDQIKREFEDVQTELFSSVIKDWNGTASREDKLNLVDWNPFSDKPALFFDPFWTFGIKDGFDVIIGNPPYVQIQKFSGQQIQIDLGNQKYETFSKTGDLYCLFYERGIKLLKEAGLLTYITSNKWMRSAYGEKLRKFIVKKNPILLIDFAGFRVFEGVTVDTNILVIENSKNKYQLKACHFKNSFKRGESIFDYVNNQSVRLKDQSLEKLFIGSEAEISLKKNIEEKGSPLKDWNIKINYGIKTSLNEAFIINKNQRDEFIQNDKKNEEIIKPILRGRDIKKFGYKPADQYIILSHNGFKKESGEFVRRVDINKYPLLKDHLNKYIDSLEKRQDQGNTSYNLRDCAYMEEFESGKIAFPVINRKWNFVPVMSHLIILAPMRFISFNSQKDLNYIFGILRSPLMLFYFKQIGNIQDEDGYQMDNYVIEKLPFPIITNQNEDISNNISNLAEMLTSGGVVGPNMEIEKKIDQYVYKLFGLSEDDVKIIEKL